MDKIYLKDNYIVTELSGVTAVFPKNYSSYSENASGFYINNTFPVNNQRAVYIDFTRVASVYNEAGTTAYTIATLRSFLLTNTGFKSPSGGSGGVWGSITGTLSSQTDLQSALDAKQDDLVSGTNIKTLEGQSLLGAGNIDLTKSDVGLGNVDNTSDLNKPISTLTQTALNAKQDTLTLTTTGTSGAATLVGDTLNIPQYSGGGGLQGINALFVRTNTSLTYSAAIVGGALSGINVLANRITVSPIYMARTITTVQFQINVTAAAAGALCRLVIYTNDNTNGIPNSVLFQSTNLDCSTTGIKTVSHSTTLNSGTIYWIGLATNATVFQCTQIPSSSLAAIPNSAFPSTSINTVATRNITYPTIPAWGTTPGFTNIQVPFIQFR
jgi:hypothetical protein